MDQTLTISLFQPGMTVLHRVGLAGLHMALDSLKRDGPELPGATWSLTERSVTLSWTGSAIDLRINGQKELVVQV